MEEDLYTITEISIQNEIPETTLRRYCEIFNTFIQEKRFGRTKKYTATSVVILKKIYKMYQEGKNTAEIQTYLGANVNELNVIQTTKPINIDSYKTMQQMAIILKQQHEKLQALEKLEEKHDKDLCTIMRTIMEVRKELAIANEQKMKQQEKRHWWQKIFK